jgi:DNA-binding transcriptional regulator YiaG
MQKTQTKNPPPMPGAQLRALRERSGLTIVWLCQQQGINLSTWQRWENGTRPVPAEVAAKMTAAAAALAEIFSKPA